MPNQQLATYLNNHLAASTSVLELLAQLAATHEQRELGPFFATLRADILTERQQLAGLMEGLAIEENSLRQAGAWLAEQVSRLKLRLDSPTAEALRLLEALEIITTGLAGKRSLWQSLSVAAEEAPALRGVDYRALIQRTEEQLQRVETVRLTVARAALTATT